MKGVIKTPKNKFTVLGVFVMEYNNRYITKIYYYDLYCVLYCLISDV